MPPAVGLTVRCHCGGRSWVKDHARLEAQNLLRRVRVCRDCHEEFATVEITEGVDLMWVDDAEAAVDAPVPAPAATDPDEAGRLSRIAASPAPTARRLKGPSRPLTGHANCRSCGKLFIRWQGEQRPFCRQCIKDGAAR